MALYGLMWATLFSSPVWGGVLWLIVWVAQR